MKQSTSIQDYLKRIYELTEDGSPASTNDLARELNVSAPSVTGWKSERSPARTNPFRRAAPLAPAPGSGRSADRIAQAAEGRASALPSE
ncbi:hypothetical protein FBR01_12365 [Anaerolineae bacterium CFX8]|nr:hypothetical protein [Anaerolineae bacterium CFX8]